MEHLIYSNLTTVGRRICASSRELSEEEAYEIERIVALAGEPSFLCKEEFLFRSVGKETWIFSRLLSVGTEFRSSRRGATYHCILLRDTDLDVLVWAPFLLKAEVQWLDRPPESARLEQLEVSVDERWQSSKFSIVKRALDELGHLSLGDVELLNAMLGAFVREKELHISSSERAAYLLELATLLTPYRFRKSISFTTYYNSIRVEGSGFSVSLDQGAFGTEEGELRRSALPFESDLRVFLDNPDLKTYQALQNWVPSDAETWPHELSMETAASVFVGTGRQKRKWWSAGMFGLVLLVIIIITADGLIDYQRCRRFEEDERARVGEIYDRYLRYSSDHPIISRFFHVHQRILTYETPAMKSEYENLLRTTDCGERLAMSRLYLQRFATSQFRHRIEVMIRSDEECYDWQMVKMESDFLAREGYYEEAVSRIERFLADRPGTRFTAEAVELRGRLAANWSWQRESNRN